MSSVLFVITLLTTGGCLSLYSDALILPCDLPCLDINDSLSDLAVAAKDCTIEPSPPFVSSMGSYNITLRWKASNISEITYMVQYKYVSIKGEWKYTQVVTETSYTVTNLQPYTEYWFRVIWIICHLQYYSASSLAYRTLADGVPSDAPQIESIVSFSSDTVEVSWLPPLFPNGRILGYILKLYTNIEVHGPVSVVGRHSFQFYGTKPATTYRFTITTRNEEGEGPTAQANVTTPNSDPDKGLWLFLSKNKTLKKRDNLKEVAHEAQCLEAQSQINGIAVNVHSQLVYYSEGNHIWIKGAANMSDMSNFKTFHTGYGSITSLSVDWLYSKLFFTMTNQIYMCDLTNCTTSTKIPLKDGLKPKKIEVDPYNGYLFLLVDDGIHRMILPESPVYSNVTEHIVKSADILDFTVIVQSKRLIYIKGQSNFSLESVFLDGTNNQLLRELNHQYIKKITSFIYFNDLLLLTTGNEVLYEEFFGNLYWYNEYVVSCSLKSASLEGFNNMILYGESAQPVPLPGHPEHVMVVFGIQSAEILWSPPRLTVGASAAAWQKWTYTVSVSSEKYGIQQFFNNITSSGITAAGLNISTKYEITVQASSSAGVSQWTNPVVGTTFDSEEEETYFLAVGTTGVWRQPLDKFGPGELLSDKLRYVSDLDWYNSTLCWSNETGYVHMWNVSNTADFSPLYIPGIRRAHSLAFDWIGHYIYWADKLNAKIHRTSLKTFSSETVNVGRNFVNDLAVDPVNAFLYWSTDYTVEISRLNGQDHLILQNLTLFSSSQVVALTLDLKDELLYWVVKNGLHINLYRTPIQKDRSKHAEITEFSSWSTCEISEHALVFYSDRIYWINGQKYITVQEVQQGSCTPFSQPAEFIAFTLASNNLKRLPVNFSHSPEVIPGPISSSSFEIQGNHSHFTIIWKGPSNIEYGTLFYCVDSFILHQEVGKSNESCHNSGKFTDSFYTVEGLEPYTEFDFAVSPYTYWGKGNTTTVTLRSPQGVPTAPLNLRVYITQNSTWFDMENIGVELRWDKPSRSNGILTNYLVSYRLLNESQYNSTVGTWLIINTTASLDTYILYNVSSEILLQFQVKAYTSAGPGPFSEIAEVSISDIHPVPALISISGDHMSFSDEDRKNILWNLTAEGNIRMASYLAHDGNIYYLVDDMILWRDTKKQSTVLLLKDGRLSGSKGMTADWIARRIYVVTNSRQNGTQLLFIDLESKNLNLEPVDTLNEEFASMTIDAIAAYPLLSRLYWIEYYNTGSVVSYFDIQNSTIVNALGQYSTKVSVNDCNCHLKTWEVITLMALDIANTSGSLIFLLCNETSIWASDMDGCNCWKVVDIKHLAECLTITSLTADAHFIYWSVKDNRNTSFFETNKVDKETVLLKTIPDQEVQVIPYSTSLQPFPDKRCLVLAPLTTKPVLQSTTNTSISLHLPPVDYELSCLFIRSSTPTYTVTYKKLLDDLDSESAKFTAVVSHGILEFQDQIALITGLQPFSNYELEVRVKNYYSFLQGEKPIGSFVTGKTDYGVPEAAPITSITVLSDSVVNISWTEPSKPNGPLNLIRYQIKTDNLLLSPSVPLMKKEFPDEKLQWSFKNLKSETLYQFKVLAFHPDENWYTESSSVPVKTFKSPAPPHIITARNTSVVLEWIAPGEPIADFWFEEYQLNYGSWYRPNEISCIKKSVYNCTISGHVPNTNYGIRTVVIFIMGAQGFSDLANFRTAAGVPNKPGVPQNVPGDKNTIQWKMAEDNGSNLTYNILEYREAVSDGRSVLWHLAYNDSCGDICLWKSKTLDGTFQFRAAAANMIGLGNYSDTSENILLSKEKGSSNEVAVAVGSVLGILLILLMVTGFVFYKKSKQKPIDKLNIHVFHEDKELANLRGFSYAVGLGNACYAVRTLPTKSEMEDLPSFPRENLTLSVFLGSGAFGEVYEGTAKDILGPGTGISKVAVKTLKSDATNNEKFDFLKEAHLMSQFHHGNILKLLGVCLFNEPQYIILELMNGGDLLTYLRGARPLSPKSKQKPIDKLNIHVFHEDKELANLRGFSYAVGLGNACYAVRTLPTKSEMEDLPSFPRENLTLSVFLGRGAFGEVYEGTAKDILGPGTGISKVAVKTLKSDATNNEKFDFLKEAHLMSQFHHGNILKLLGVCLFNEPQYIILELMNGGDLLTYLRGARPLSPHGDPLLSPLDLLDIAVDISTGCAYLEKMHFVHRDLAARNCLVSVKEYNSPDRTVKIGDFGLARDVYKTDYYRKKGEGLLPVRWMSPESLIDGIFTTHSDVWSFGVLLWELFTLGQQPYQGFSNMEVVHYIRSGQRMDSPDNCPDNMLDLMLECWTQEPFKRPSFAHIHAQLEELKSCSLRCSCPKKRRVDLQGVNNLGFEDSEENILGSASEETGSVTLTETRNADGLNYLMVAT